MDSYLLTFPNTESAFKISDDIFEIIIDTVNSDVSRRYKMKLIVSELYMNAYMHGNKSDPEKEIDVVLEIDDDSFTATVKDSGAGIARERFKEMVASISAPEDESGRGMSIVHKLCDKVQLFKDSDDKFCVRATMKIERESDPEKRGRKKKKLEAV